MSDPIVPNYKKDVGRLATDRFDFQEHVDGVRFKHNADAIDVIPNLVIGSESTTNVMESLEALNELIESITPADATTTSKGLIQLAGDIGGTATNIVVTRIQGKPISTLTPSSGNVLTWDGYVWKPAAPINVFSAGNDLSGSNISQNVIGFTGVVTSPGTWRTVTGNCTVVDFVHNADPLITQDFAQSGSDGRSMTIRAQSATGGSRDGGDLILASGAPGPTGPNQLRGSVKIRFTHSLPAGYPRTALPSGSSYFSNMIELSEPAVGRRVLSLCNPSNLTTADMPSNSGDMVMYIRDAVTDPSTGSPSNGSILYSSGGQLWVKQQDGNNFAVGSIPNPSIWGNVGQQTWTERNYVQSTTAAVLAFSFTLQQRTAAKIDVILVGKRNGSNDSAQFNLSMGYSRNTGSPVAVGSVTNADPRTSGGASGWTIPNITISGNTMQVFTGFSSGITIQWFVVTQITTSSSS